MVFIGLISYPLYLWHLPLLSYLSTLRVGAATDLEALATIIFAIIVSWLTFRFVETPVRRRKNAPLRLGFGLAAVGVAGMVTVNADGFGFRYPPEIREIAMLASYNNAGFRDKCFLESPGSEFNEQCIESGTKPLLFLLGDSNAAALYPGLKKAEESFPFRLAHFTAPGCAPIRDHGTNARCDGANKVAFEFIKSSAPEIVLLHAMWGGYADLKNLPETIRQLKALGVPRVVILGPVPGWKRTLPRTLVNYYRFRHVIVDRSRCIRSRHRSTNGIFQ